MKDLMPMLRFLLCCMFACALLPVKGQGELVVYWSAYAKDTVMPVFVHSVDLGYDHGYDYTVEIEYPEFIALTASEVLRFCLPEEAGLPEWPELKMHKGVSAKRGQLDVSFVPIVWRDGKYWRIQTFTLKVHRNALAPRKSRVAEAERYAAHSVLSAGRWVKVRVADNGIHMFTHAALKNMGFNDPSKVRLYGYGGHMLSESDAGQWRDDLCEVGVWRGDDRILFYANGPVKWTLDSDNTFTHSRNPYSNYGYYFLTEGGDVQKVVSSSAMNDEAPLAGAQDRALVSTTPAYALYEVDDYAWFHGGRKLVDSYDFMNGNVRNYPLNVCDAYVGGKAVLDVCFTQNASSISSLAVAMDGVELGTSSLKLIGAHDEAAETTPSYGVSLNKSTSQYTVTLTHHRNAGISGRLDYLRLSYTSHIKQGKEIYATNAGTHTYVVDNGNANTIVWCITDASSPVRIGSVLDGSTLTFAATGKRGDMYVAFDPKSSYPMPEVVGEVANQDLHATEATDYIIIVPTSGKLTAQAERLAASHRAHRGLTVKVVRADEVYNEFSSGTPDATAYRRYMKMLYDRAATSDEAPKYLLLFGDGAWDNRMLSSAWQRMSPDDYLLCYEAENSLNAVDSYVVEDYFGLLDDGEGANLKTDKVDIGVGRFPITTVSQARAAVDKIEAYMTNANAGAWKNTILMLGDDGDRNRHMDDAELVAQMLEEEYLDYMVKRIYWDAFPMEKTSTGNSYPVVRKRLLELFRDGALMVNYSGHGAPDVLSHELVINKTDMEKLTSPRLPVWVTVSCDITPFDNAVVSFGESAFLNPKGGAIGLLTSTRTTYAEQNRRINYFFSKYTFARGEDGRRLSLGDALRLAKCNLITTGQESLIDRTGNKLNYVLIGDPALVVGNADYIMRIDSLNGMPVGSSDDVLLKAGSQVVAHGHVETLHGTLASDFSGVLYASVFDNVEDVVCRNNANGKDLEGNALKPFAYRERTKRIFVGIDSVSSGKFSFTFRVPMDINYSMESGLINLYALSDTREHEAKGVCDKFLLGGTEENLSSDGLGPQIQLYLNSPSFVSGGRVNETPLLVAKMQDVDGINMAGSIGHNMTAIIDGEASMTYNLNEYYSTDIGSYERGTVSYLLPELSEGKHTLVFRAWDMMNNSSVATIEFEVVKGLTPDILHVQALPDLLQGTTTFMLTHDRPENEVEVAIEVFDMSGRIVWSHNEQTISSGNTYSFCWSQCSASGQPLGEGVYLYRVVVTSPSGSSASKAQKMVLIR